MSQVAVESPSGPSAGRVAPRWSVEGGGHPGSPASIAGLDVVSSCVWVSPPLYARPPSNGSVLFQSPSGSGFAASSLNPQLEPLSRLCPLEVTGGTLPFEKQESFTIELASSTVPPTML